MSDFSDSSGDEREQNGTWSVKSDKRGKGYLRFVPSGGRPRNLQQRRQQHSARMIGGRTDGDAPSTNTGDTMSERDTRDPTTTTTSQNQKTTSDTTTERKSIITRAAGAASKVGDVVGLALTLIAIGQVGYAAWSRHRARRTLEASAEKLSPGAMSILEDAARQARAGGVPVQIAPTYAPVTVPLPSRPSGPAASVLAPTSSVDTVPQTVPVPAPTVPVTSDAMSVVAPAEPAVPAVSTVPADTSNTAVTASTPQAPPQATPETSSKETDIMSSVVPVRQHPQRGAVDYAVLLSHMRAA